jgi:hypothetical protein
MTALLGRLCSGPRPMDRADRFDMDRLETLFKEEIQIGIR